MEINIKIDPVEENDKMLLFANSDKILLGLWNWRYNIKKEFEHKIDTNKFENQYDLLDSIFEEFWETFPNINVE